VKVVIAGGGTGGHIYPALTIADAIKKQEPEAEITFVGTRKGLEKDIVPRYGYPLEFIRVAGFDRHLGLGTLKSAGELLLGMGDAYSLINRINPELVVGTGGYVCGPVLFWGAMKRVATCIQEQNAMPGVTNKILSRFVDKVFLGYKAGERYLSGSSEKIVTGNPVRAEILESTREEGIAKFGLDPAMKTLLVFGGSRGARTINESMIPVEKALAGNRQIQILHATGTYGYAAHMEAIGSAIKDCNNIHVVPYLHEMPLALAAADLAVSRAGAIGLAELMVKGIPSILIPYPYATANHQEYNARALAGMGAAEVILDKDLNGEILLATIQKLFKDPDLLRMMHKGALKAGNPDAADQIAKAALEMVYRNRRNA
jgi:UDP-N-acetylglucosamine--N-acetylmuramyl-(pentapeptide) pyrophosphoryl-undecaprenol N-acetylglucosamine transferase